MDRFKKMLGIMKGSIGIELNLDHDTVSRDSSLFEIGDLTLIAIISGQKLHQNGG